MIFGLGMFTLEFSDRFLFNTALIQVRCPP